MLDRLAAVSSGSIKGRNLPRWVRVGLASLLLVWLAWALANTAWLLLSGPSRLVPQDESLPRLERGTDAPGSAGPALTLNQINDWELFGPAQQQAAMVVDAPETRLRLELLGVFQHPSDELASAIVAEQGKDGELFYIGDRLPGNATLEQVLTDRVILLRAGQRETLRMKEPELDGEIAMAPEESSYRTETETETDTASQSEVNTSQQPVLAEQRARIVDGLGLTPADEGGYRIGNGAQEQALQAVGLRQGDVLISVNGFELGSEESDLAALRAFHDSGSASVVVQRGDQTFTINYPP